MGGGSASPYPWPYGGGGNQAFGNQTYTPAVGGLNPPGWAYGGGDNPWGTKTGNPANWGSPLPTPPSQNLAFGVGFGSGTLAPTTPTVGPLQDPTGYATSQLSAGRTLQDIAGTLSSAPNSTQSQAQWYLQLLHPNDPLGSPWNPGEGWMGTASNNAPKPSTTQPVPSANPTAQTPTPTPYQGPGIYTTAGGTTTFTPLGSGQSGATGGTPAGTPSRTAGTGGAGDWWSNYLNQINYGFNFNYPNFANQSMEGF